MQSTSATWKALWAAGNARLETKAVIAGVEYTEMSNPVISRALVQDGMGVGNVVSATCQFAILTDDDIPRAAQVQIRMRLTDGTTDSEWLPAGTFYISRRRRDPVTGILTLECYDALLKANALLSGSGGLLEPWTDENGNVISTESDDAICFSQITYPCAMSDAVGYIAQLLGLGLDSRTEIETGSIYVVDAPEAGTTIRDVLSYVGAANGGNWIVTPEGKLRLVPLTSAAGAADAETDVADVEAVTGALSVPGSGAVTGVRYPSEDVPVVLGSESGIVIDVDIGAALASALYDTVAGMTYQAYSLTGAIYDPAVELGDYVRAGANGEVSSVLYGETVTLGVAVRGDLAAPEAGELSDEYPYIGGSEKILAAAKVYAAQQVSALDDSLDQQSVFNRLTEYGAARGIYMVDGQLYVNMSYARSGTLVLGGANNGNGLLRVEDAAGNVIGTWTKDGIALNKGTIAGPSVTLGGDGNADGVLQVLDSGGNVIGSWDKDGVSLSKGSIAGPSISLGGLNDADGVLQIKDASGHVIGTWDSSGITISSGTIESADGNVELDLDGAKLTTTGSYGGHDVSVEVSGGRIELSYGGTVLGYIDATNNQFNIDGGNVVIGDITGSGARLEINSGSIGVYGDIQINDVIPAQTGVDATFTVDGKTLTFVHGILVDVS